MQALDKKDQAVPPTRGFGLLCGKAGPYPPVDSAGAAADSFSGQGAMLRAAQHARHRSP